ncbi:hypothetical protein NG99_22560 [Erwinia typographi]|uniref:Uncharacterized protein n=1 Tax=Erwinia typographi TaxID=371042 RepID=A0A0A3ZPW7_9GAMM|nr:hypothetical protein [Erwinia typographi]KGT87768.1 hypothetical protein NG99_22560 [Erwinia typographi]
MRELKLTEVSAVSGAGKLQDNIAASIGDFFTGIFNKVSTVIDLGYTKDDANNLGTDVGQRVGGIIESHVNKLINYLSSWSK